MRAGNIGDRGARLSCVHGKHDATARGGVRQVIDGAGKWRRIRAS